MKHTKTSYKARLKLAQKAYNQADPKNVDEIRVAWNKLVIAHQNYINFTRG